MKVTYEVRSNHWYEGIVYTGIPTKAEAHQKCKSANVICHGRISLWKVEKSEHEEHYTQLPVPWATTDGW